MNPLEFSEFLEQVKQYGLESLGLFYSSYRGKVIDNDDPENMGRLKITCHDIYGDEEFGDWVLPKGVNAAAGSGIFWLPPVGAPIFISCEGGDARLPLWEYGWWLKNSAPEGSSNKVQVFLTTNGQRIELDDTEKTVDVKQKDGFHVKLFPDGIYLGNGDGTKNLGKLLTDLFTLLEQTTVATLAGPQPFINLAAYTSLKAQIAPFLKTS